jgi:riboflavin kinase/FMN adenylyltransferase
MTIGVFDGLHLGHQALIRRVVDRGRALGANSVVLTFEPHPLAVLSPASAPEVLTSFEQKADFLATLGLSILGRLPFKDICAFEARRFLDEALPANAQPLELFVGPDFRFGRGAEGHLGLLRDWAKNRRVEIVPVELQRGHGEAVYSSSSVRSLLKVGLVAAAAAALGRPYRLSGRVVAGAARGRRLGFPTANLSETAQLIPGPGVYAVRARLQGRTLHGMTSIGHNPTFGAKYLTVETHIFDFAEDIYGAKLEVDFVAHLRGMSRFDGPEALKAQLMSDEARARQILADR